MKQSSTDTRHKEKTLRWEAPEFDFVEKSNDWYWTVGGIGAACATGAFLGGVITLGILIIISTGLLCYMANHKPRMIIMTINSKHLQVDIKKYSMKEIESFRIHTEHNKLLLKPASKIKPIIPAPLPTDAQLEKLITLLTDKLKLEEDETIEEPWIEVYMRKLGF